MERVHLIGAETVGNAGHDMKQAAQDMLRAANIINSASQQLYESMSELRNQIEVMNEIASRSKHGSNK